MFEESVSLGDVSLYAGDGCPWGKEELKWPFIRVWGLGNGPDLGVIEDTGGELTAPVPIVKPDRLMLCGEFSFGDRLSSKGSSTVARREGRFC